jgi:hypothetical protein
VVARGVGQVAAEPAQGDDAGVQGVAEAGRACPGRAGDGLDRGQFCLVGRVKGEARAGGGEHLAGVADLVGGGRLVQGAGGACASSGALAEN